MSKIYKVFWRDSYNDIRVGQHFLAKKLTGTSEYQIYLDSRRFIVFPCINAIIEVLQDATDEDIIYLRLHEPRKIWLQYERTEL